MMRKALLALITMTAMHALSSCSTTGPSGSYTFDLGELNVDPAECTGISLRNDVPVRKEVIHEPSIMLDRFLIVLRYREGGDDQEDGPKTKKSYNNISLVSEVKADTDSPLIVYRRYCVIEMWRIFPERKVKYCYLWIIGEESVTMKIMLEGFGGEFLNERHIALNALTIEKLKAYYGQLSKEMVEMLKDPVPYENGLVL
jgi:hypothetical protein